MPRKRKSPLPKQETPTLALGLAPGAERVLVLGRERDRLMLQVGQKKRLLERCEGEVERAREALAARLGGVVAERHELDRDTHDWFAKILAPGRLAKRKRKQVISLYMFLQAEEVLSPREVDFDEPDAPDFTAPGPSFDVDEEQGAREPRMAASAPKVAAVGQDALRALFKRLAVALHPDRARAEDKERLTEVMKEVTRAYEEQDLARLLEIERREDSAGTLSAMPTSNDERVRSLERAIEELRRQLRELSKAVRELKRTEVYEIARSLGQSARRDPIAEIEQATRADLARLRSIRDYARDFFEGKLSFERFMEGPPPTVADEDALEAMLETLFEGIEFSPQPKARGKRRRPPPDPGDIPF